MSSTPKTILEKGNLTNKVARILSLLKNSGIDSRHKLVQKWESNPYFMLDAYQLWFDDSKAKLNVKSVWPPKA